MNYAQQDLELEVSEVPNTASNINYRNLEGSALMPTGSSQDVTEMVFSVQVTTRNKMF